LFEQYRARISQEDVPLDANGWAEFIQPKSPKTWIYVKRAATPGLPIAFDAIVCGYFDECTITACLRPNLSVALRFYRKKHPRETWGALVPHLWSMVSSTLADP
jgi:hypothetical protein